MGIKEKLLGAKQTSWIAEGISEAEVKTIVDLAKISARIERYRIELGMTQQEFAEYMGVSQGMISKWESREYNFTIRSLNEICQKLDLDFSVSIDNLYSQVDYDIIKWEEDRFAKKENKNDWRRFLSNKEAIA